MINTQYFIYELYSFVSSSRYAFQPDPVNHSQVITDQAASARVKYVHLSAVYLSKTLSGKLKDFD